LFPNSNFPGPIDYFPIEIYSLLAIAEAQPNIPTNRAVNASAGTGAFSTNFLLQFNVTFVPAPIVQTNAYESKQANETDVLGDLIADFGDSFPELKSILPSIIESEPANFDTI
jgi:hypothetical protein